LPFTGAAHPHPSAVHVNPAAINLAGRGLHQYLGARRSTSCRSIAGSSIPIPPEITGRPARDHAHPVGDVRLYYEVPTSLALASFAPMPNASRGSAFRYHSRGGHYQWTLLALAGSWRITSRFIIGASLGQATSLAAAQVLPAPGARRRQRQGRQRLRRSAVRLENPAAEQRYRIR
jgi:hypothetical protein